MERVAILGLGLMGGSLGLGLKEKGGVGTVVAYARREESRQAALDQGMADAVFDSPADAVKGADVAVLCVPILTMPDLLEQTLPGLGAGTVVTDVGSTKAALVEQLRPAVNATGAAFIGSHPVAGSEQQGLEAAITDLYADALTVVTPVEGDDEDAVQRVKALWEGLGSHVQIMTPEAHDEIMARTSHLPHIVAALLATTVGRTDSLDETAAFCGTGFRDTTRIAEGSAEVWRDIVESNNDSLMDELDAFQRELDALRDLLNRSDYQGVEAWLAASREKRKALVPPRAT